MTRTSLLAATAILAATAAQADLGPLATAFDLQGEQAAGSAPVVIDIRPKGYEAGHIEGAISAPYGLFRGPADNPGQTVAIDALETTLEGLGLSPDQQIVIVSQGDTDTDFGASARVYWTLKSAGFPQLSILNGGAQAWVNAGLPVSTEATTLPATDLALSWDDTWTAETPEVADVVAGNRDAVLLDARPRAFFDGEQAHEAARKPGTIAGAESLEYTQFFQPGATAINPQVDVDAILATYGVTEGEEIVSFCNTGHWAATNWFALSELGGVPNVKLYPGSMVEYSTTENEMANVPGLLKNLIGQFK